MMLFHPYCNHCGTPFPTQEASQRFCNRTCSSLYLAPVQTSAARQRNNVRQREVLAVLQAHAGAWVSTAQIAETVYGASDVSERHCVYQTTRRLRTVVEGEGTHRIETRQTGSHGLYDYRLVTDVASVLAVAS